MRANPDHSRLLAAACALMGVALLVSCVEIKDASDQKATADSAAGAVAKSTPPPAPATKSTASFAPDSVTHVRGGPLFTPEAVIALQTDTAHSVTDIDTAAATAIPESDVAELKREMIIPVRGIAPSALYDTYDEKRGGGTRPHEALDIPAPRGTPVLSATSGRVLKLFDSKAGGKMVYAADSTEHFILMYAHLDSYANGLAEGQPLQRGQVLGAVGTTGNAPPNLPHLHFAIARSTDVKQWWKGSPVNPYPLLLP